MQPPKTSRKKLKDISSRQTSQQVRDHTSRTGADPASCAQADLRRNPPVLPLALVLPRLQVSTGTALTAHSPPCAHARRATLHTLHVPWTDTALLASLQPWPASGSWGPTLCHRHPLSPPHPRTQSWLPTVGCLGQGTGLSGTAGIGRTKSQKATRKRYGSL